NKLSSGQKISTRDIPIETAQDFLAVAHAIGLGSADGLSSEFEFRVDYDENPREETGEGYFIKKDHFTFELVQKQS
ncbi:MAG: flagellar protein FliT, partial [Thalassolituus sp.]